MKRNFIYIILLIWLVAKSPVAYGQEARLTGTLKMHPWVTLPVVVSSDIKGGMQTLGTLDLTTPATILNTTVPASKRDVGMIVSTIDNVTNQPRFFEYTATDTWKEVYVTQSWEAGHTYATGDFVAYSSNYYIANAAFTSSVLFITDIANWNNAGGKDAVYDLSKLNLNKTSVTRVAKSGDVVTTALLDSTLTTAGYVSLIASNSVNFNVDRPITRLTLTGGVTGINLGTGKTVTQFLDAFFFPALAATAPTSVFSTAQSTYPYSTWKSWGSPATSNISFTWGVTNLSIIDATDDKLITSIKLKTGATVLNTVAPVTGGNQAGTFSSIPFTYTSPNPKALFSTIYTLEVIDAQPNTVTKDITLTMSPAIALSYATPTLTPATAVYEYSPNNIPLTLNWVITPNDETISSILVNGTATGSTSATGSQAVSFKTIANGGTQSQSFPLTATGNIYGAGTAKNTAAVSWDNRLYRGVISSAVLPSDGSFAFTDAQVKTALTLETKLGGDWKLAAGYDFACGALGQYVVFAYPDDAVTPTVQYWDPSFGNWMSYPASDITIINRANFVNQNLYSGTNYKLIFVDVQYFGATVKIRLQ